jgi:putative transposase
MARLARVVATGAPHLVTQRGNRRQPVFFNDGDYESYRELLAAACRAAGVGVWAYCLMPDHVHLVLRPTDAGGLAAALGEAHRRYTRAVNLREGWCGFLWQGRFSSFPVDDAHLLDCVRYVETNPVRAGLKRRARDWRWSSARAHLARRGDGLVDVKPLARLAGDWAAFLAPGQGDEAFDAIRRCTSTGRPLGEAKFVKGLEKKLGRTLARRKPGPKRAEDADN